MDNKRDYDIDEIGGEPLFDSGFETEEPEKADELTLEEVLDEIGGNAA